MLEPLTPRSAQSLLSPSARVLAAAAAPDAGVSRAAMLPWSDVHWPTLISLTSFERAEAQVFRLLRAAPVGAVPEDVHHAMQGLCRVAVFRGVELAEAAARAADALDSAGVEVLWLKGAALAMQSAEDFGLRSMGDLDLLVAPERHAAARTALVAAGWRDGGADVSYVGHHHDVPLTWRGGIRLELHTGLFPPGHPFLAEPASAWLARSVAVRWGEREVRVLPRSWHLVHASVHWAWNHEGEVGSWQYLHDVQWLRAGSDMANWTDVTSATKVLGAEIPVGWALWAASRLSDLQVPDAVVATLRSRGWFAGLAEREWVLRSFYSPAASPSITWSRYWWRRAMRGLGDDTAAWPWVLGRAGVASSSEVLVAERGRSVATRAQWWRRHLARVLRG